VLQRDLQAIDRLVKLYEQGNNALKTAQPELMSEIADLAERIDLPYTRKNIDELLQRSRDGLKRIQQIVKDLRDFARLDESDLNIVDLNAGLESTLNIIRPRATKKDVKIETELGNLPRVECYPAKVNQVFMNLIANAIDASPQGGKVVIRTNATNGVIVVDVIDRGHGIEPAVRARIFDPFFTTKPQGEGTGLGLSISYGIVQDHGGTIEVDSEPGKGATFTVRLPTRHPMAVKSS
jgi:signal transduction histidine kinase